MIHENVLGSNQLDVKDIDINGIKQKGDTHVERPQRKEIQGMVEMDDGLLIYSATNGSVISLNPSARRIWELCDGTRTEQEICQFLAQDLGVSEKELLPDIQMGLKDLRENGLIL